MNITTAGKTPSDSKLRLVGWFRSHKEKLWWLHSFYALVLGSGFMWLGTKNFAFLRVAVFHIGFIWLSSLLLPKLLDHPLMPRRWQPRMRLLVNLFNKNLYQQLLFFVLPIYYASATLSSGNFAFVALVGMSATLSTLDIIYDRYLAIKPSLTAVFFAFNLFVLINVMLPVLWSVSNISTTRVSAVLALAGFITLYAPRSPMRGRVTVVLVGFLFFGLVEAGRPFIPPAPLRLSTIDLGTNFQPESIRIESPLSELTPARALRLYGLTSIKAPLGLKDQVQHRWYRNGKLICASPYYNIVGGREDGFRLWTRCTIGDIEPDTELRLDLETEGGQLIGRKDLKGRSPRGWFR